VELTLVVELTSIVLGVSVQPSVSVLEGHDVLLNFDDDDVAPDDVDPDDDDVADSEKGVDEWTGKGNYNKEKKFVFKYYLHIL
jgi:hypothetical protein